MMGLHRLNTHNLPATRSLDGDHVMDASNDFPSSPQRTAQRSMPLPIPLSRSSPTSSRGALFASQGPQVPPIPSLNPPPILSLDPPPLPSSHPYHHDEDSMTENWDGSEGNGSVRSRRKEDMRDREGRGSQRLPPNDWATRTSRKHGDPQYDSPGSFEDFSSKNARSFPNYWQNDFSRKSPKHTKESRLQNDVSIRGAMEKSVKAYDNSLVAKLNGGARSEPSQRSYFNSSQNFRPLPFTSASEDSPLLPAHWRQHKEYSRNRPTSNPIPIPSPGSPHTPFERWAQSSNPGDGVPPRLGLAEPGHSAFPLAFTDIRNSGDNASVSSYHTDNDAHSNGDARMRRSMSASLLGPSFDDSGIASSIQSRNSYDPYEDSDQQMEDAPSHVSQMKRLTLHEARTPPKSNSYPNQLNHQRAGLKRRASSPPNEDVTIGSSEPTRKGLLLESVGSGIYDHSRRTSPTHQGGIRNSPGGPSKYHTSSGMFHSPVPRSASGSFAPASASSATTQWSSSIGPFSVASSITTVDRGSPATSFTPSMDMEIVGDAPFRQSQLSLAANRSNNGQRTHSETTVTAPGTERDTVVKHHPAPKMTSVYTCECCPKKPKKFESLCDLQMHETEKQYGCQYCNNRFKNKNEAERHQNSLHLRKHSWSCAALCTYEAAFHQSPQRPSTADICGYCGKEFPSPPQWDPRIEHLVTEHKFGECNQSKKFYRADHFRQHLKHSHSGTSGKWTNVLENACMRDEMPPVSGSLSGMGSCPTSAISEEGSD